METSATFVAYTGYRKYSEPEMITRSAEFLEMMKRRRTVRDFSPRAVPRIIVENCIAAAGRAVSGANMQPWTFVVVQDPGIKSEIRIAAEAEEREFYDHRAPREWLDALSPLGTGTEKPFLETAPYLIVIFQQRYGLLPDGRKVKHYYAVESVGIAAGVLITALHHAGLVSLTHTPSPMGFLNRILARPRSERPFLLLVTGYPGEGVTVPDIGKKSLSEITVFL